MNGVSVPATKIECCIQRSGSITMYCAVYSQYSKKRRVDQTLAARANANTNTVPTRIDD